MTFKLHYNQIYQLKTPLDPFHVPQFDVPSISNGIVNAKITITNVIGRHLSLFEVISVKTVLNDDFKQGNLLKGIDNKN